MIEGDFGFMIEGDFVYNKIFSLMFLQCRKFGNILVIDLELF